MLDLISVVAGLIAVIVSPFLVVNWITYAFRRKENRVFPLKSTAAFLAPIIVGAATSGISALIAECEVAEFLQSVSPNYTISVDSHTAPNRDQILESLRSFRGMAAHHSSPTRILQVDISDPPRHLLLWVARDSNDAHEYWVFAPSPSKLALRAGLKKDIGHIKTSVLDAY